jgi:hypothetical protein
VRKIVLVVLIILLNIILTLNIPNAWSEIKRLNEDQMNTPLGQMISSGRTKATMMLVRANGKSFYLDTEDSLFTNLKADSDFEIGAHQLVYVWGNDGILCAYHPITGQPVFCESQFMAYEVAQPQYRVCSTGPLEAGGYFINQGDVGCIEVTASYRKRMNPYNGIIIAESVEPQYPPRPIGQYALRTRVINAVTTLDEMDILIKYGNNYLGVVSVKGVVARMNSDMIIETYKESKKYFGYFLGWVDTK